MITPEFSDKYTLQVVVDDDKEKGVIKIIEQILKWERSLSPITRTIDIESGV
jgi:hypothetical protein